MQDKLLPLITGALEEINETREDKIPTDDLPNIALYGDSGVFDSMQLVSFLTLVEEALEDTFDVEISLTSEKAVSRKVSPFSRVSRLLDFIEEEMQLIGGSEAGEVASDELARQV